MAIPTEPRYRTMNKPIGSAQEQLLAVLQTANNRLEHLTRNDWVLIIDRAKQLIFKKGETLIWQGKQTKMVYLLVKGRAKVKADFETRMAEIGPGEICGEMSFLDHGHASASVIAEEDVEVHAVEWSTLEDLFEMFPHLASRFYQSLAVNLSRRVREQISPKQSGKS